jgi:hypothetical protein
MQNPDADDLPPKYPEHEKLRAVKHLTQNIHDFLEWLETEKNIGMGEFEADDDEHVGDFYPISARIEDLIAEFFEIDLKVLENEKRAMLDEFREAMEKLKEKTA